MKFTITCQIYIIYIIICTRYLIILQMMKLFIDYIQKR